MSVRAFTQKSKILLGTALLLFCGFAGVDKLVSDHSQEDVAKCSSQSPQDLLTHMLVATVIVHCAYIVVLLACSIKMLHCAAELQQGKHVEIFYDSGSKDITGFTAAVLLILFLTSMAVEIVYIIVFLDMHDMHSCLSTYSMSYYVLNTVTFAMIGSCAFIAGGIFGLLLCMVSVALIVWCAGLGIIEISKLCRQLSPQRGDNTQ